jgi:hypothetical protein
MSAISYSCIGILNGAEVDPGQELGPGCWGGGRFAESLREGLEKE